MKKSLDDDLNKVYEPFNQNHNDLRQELMASLPDCPKHQKKVGLMSHLLEFTGGTIMNNRIKKFAAAAVIIIVTIIIISQFNESINGTSVAFGEVLRQIQNYSYTFDLSVVTEEGASDTVKAMVLEPGRMRADMSTGLGKISSIVDMTKDKSLLLFHKQKAAIKQIPRTESEYRKAAGILAFTTQPVENLWNLRDGTQENLGKKEIDGQSAEGFNIFQEDKYFKHEIIVWAHTKTGIPILVEMTLNSLEDSSNQMRFTMKNFDLDTELDEGLFDLEVPSDYTVAHQVELDELKEQMSPTNEAVKVEKVMTLWSDGKKNEAIETLLRIDWTKPIVFSRKSYFFSLREKEYITLRDKDQRRVMKEVMGMAGQVRPIVQEVLNQGQAAKSAQDYKMAEQHFEAVREFGSLLTRDSERMLIVRLAGLATRRKALNELKLLYEQSNQRQKLQQVENEIQAVDAESQEIRSSLSGE